MDTERGLQAAVLDITGEAVANAARDSLRTLTD